jgi:NTP pyrophosphatase (non-canonical NTP hydrolase)
MFAQIYERRVDDRARSTLGLFEELGELAEAIRVFDRFPKYLAGEAADVFSYLMGVANEHALRRAQDNEPEFSLGTEFLRRYPGLCVQCGYYVCLCPPIPQATIGRLAKKLTFQNRFSNGTKSPGRQISEQVISSVGGYSALAKQFPLDR